MLKITPGEHQNLEGTTINLSMEEQKGEPESELFRIVKFQRSKPKDLALIDVVLTVHLFCPKYETFYKATFDDPSKVVPDTKVPMGIIVYTLEEILTGRAGDVLMSYENNDGKDDLLITTVINSKIFNRTVTFKFCYKFLKAEFSNDERIDMRLGMIEQELKEQGIGKEERLNAVEESLRHMGIDSQMWFIPGKRIMPAQFDVSKNNHHTSAGNGSMLIHSGTDKVWNTTPVNIPMKNTVAYRGRFRVMSHMFDCMMFGVVSSSYSKYTGCPDNGGYGWMAYFYDSKLNGSCQHNGSLQNAGGPSPFTGSVITVEYYPNEGRIQYFVNTTPVGQLMGCSFNNGDCRFAISLYHTGTKVKLLSVEQIENIF